MCNTTDDDICAKSTLVVRIETFSIVDAICATDAVVVGVSCDCRLISFVHFTLALTSNTLLCTAMYLIAFAGSKLMSHDIAERRERTYKDEAARKRRLTFDDAVAIRDGRQPPAAHMSLDMALRIVENAHERWPTEFPRDA